MSKIIPETESIDQGNRSPKTYFDLMEIVGSFGTYQLVLTVTFALVWFSTGIILMSTAFLYLNPSFDCKQFGLLVDDCRSYVCALPENQWSKYIPESQKQFKSLANSFNQEYYCDRQIQLDLASTMTYLGGFIGYTVISFFSDNWGRKTSLTLSWGLGCLGIVILICSQHIYMAGTGLFFCALGCDSAVNITIFIFGQTLENQRRQSYSVIIMSFFCTGSILITGLFYLFKDWFWVSITGLAIPMFITLFLIIFYVEETPAFLVKKGVQDTLKAMNRIARINKKQEITEEDVNSVVENQVDADYKDKMITPIDLIRFPSLRIATICLAIANFTTYAMYYGPVLIVDSIGFDIYTSNVMINLADLASYLPSYFFIEKQPRRFMGVMLFGVATIMAGLLVFIVKPDDCDGCYQGIVQIILVFIFRFAIGMEFTVLIIFGSQLYPGRARALGNGMVSAFGTIASTISPIFLGFLDRANINVMIFFTITGIIGLGAYTLLNETHGKVIPQEIEEIELQKEKKRSYISISKSRVQSIRKGSQLESNSNQSKKSIKQSIE